MQLSKNFALWEFTISQTAQRQGLKNEPGKRETDNLILLCDQILQPARETLGPLHISSGFRSGELNKRVGGSFNSAHKEGFAADVVPVECSKLEFAKWIAKNCKFDQLILEFGTSAEPSWIHVSCDPRHRRQVMRILKGTGYQSVMLT